MIHSDVSVFCSLHRILGSLISAHILLTDPRHPFGDVGLKDYDNELLHLAHDLAVRLLPAFENTSTGIPYPRVRPVFFYVGLFFVIISSLGILMKGFIEGMFVKHKNS